MSKEQFVAVINSIESQSVSSEQVAEVVTAVLALGVSSEQATELATSAKVLESVNSDQAVEIFAEVPVDTLTTEQEAALVEAVQEAPTEVRAAFEGTIDIFGSGIDEYVPLGSNIDVKDRRALIAVAAVVSTLAMSGGPTSGPGSSGGSSGGTGGGGSDTGNGNSRKEEEIDDEYSGEIAGPEKKKNKFTKNSIFKYY